VEVLIEMDVHRAAVGLLDLDLVVALFAANFGRRDLAAARVLERGRLGRLDRAARDRRAVAVIGGSRRRGDRSAAAADRRDRATRDERDLEPLVHWCPPASVWD